MNKFKAFFTFLAFLWLWLCGFAGIYALTNSGNVAWAGLVINAWALPIWVSIRYLQPSKYPSDIRESPAFAGVLLGLGVALLTDVQKGPPVYLAIYNLFVCLIYLYHLSAVRYPPLPTMDAHFPVLAVCGRAEGRPSDLCREGVDKGVLVIFLRGAFCKDSRTLLAELAEQAQRVRDRGVSLLLIGVQPKSQWPESLLGSAMYWQLDPNAPQNAPFVASFGAPLVYWGQEKAAARPCAWLLDAEGYVVWRYLPDNYRAPGNATLLTEQLYRLED